jgi:hypothetical protein
MGQINKLSDYYTLQSMTSKKNEIELNENENCFQKFGWE